MNLSKSEKIIFSILGVIGIGIVCNKVIYPGFLALKEGQSQNVAKDFVQEDFVLPLQEDLQKAGFAHIRTADKSIFGKASGRTFLHVRVTDDKFSI